MGPKRRFLGGGQSMTGYKAIATLLAQRWRYYNLSTDLHKWLYYNLNSATFSLWLTYLFIYFYYFLGLALPSLLCQTIGVTTMSTKCTHYPLPSPPPFTLPTLVRRVTSRRLENI